jgi:hypothetical protein
MIMTSFVVICTLCMLLIVCSVAAAVVSAREYPVPIPAGGRFDVHGE